MPAAWRDPKRLAFLLGLGPPTLPLGAMFWVWATGLHIFWWYGPIFIYGLIPIADWLIGKDASNPPESAVAELERDDFYVWCIYLTIPLQFIGLFACGWVWAHGRLDGIDNLGLAITCGCASGIAINTAHELGHKPGRLAGWLSKLLLSPSVYGHFYTEHNRCHHAMFATPEDPASARLGEGFWAFLPRTILGSVASAWALEAKRLKGRVWTWRNEVLNAWALSAVLFAGLVLVFGARILPWLVIQAVFGLCLLEAVNYIEHYGLLRQKTADGRYERCAPRHSWNSNNLCTNMFLYHLQRHADHHAHAARKYQALRSYDDAPELPSGYSAMIMLVYVPWLWRRVMDGRVAAVYGGDVSLANIQPGLAGRYLPGLQAR